MASDQIQELAKQARLHGATHPELWLQLAQLEARFGAYSHATSSLRKAAESNSASPPLLLQAADLAKQLEDQPLAKELYLKALPHLKEHPGAFLALADTCERLNQLDEATQYLEAIPASRRNEPPCLLIEAKLLRRSGAPEKALEKLASLFRNENLLPPPLLIQAHHERYASLDKLGRFDEAYDALRQSKEINRGISNPARIQQMQQAKRKSYQRLRSIIRHLDSHTLTRWKETSPRSPFSQPAFLLGHPRSGTTLLENILESHHSLISSDERPVFQFQAIDPITAKFRVPQGTEDEAHQAFLTYLSKLSDKTILGHRNAYGKELEHTLGKSLRNSLLLDKNPAITDGALIALRIFPHAKFLFALRDPRAVVWSAFSLPMVNTSWIGAFWFDLETTAEAYAMITDLWLEFRDRLPAGQAHTVTYESLVQDPLTEGRRATEFLGLSWEPSQEQFHTHAQQKQVRSPTYADVVKPVYTKAVEHWKNYAPFLSQALPHLERHLALFGYPQD